MINISTSSDQKKMKYSSAESSHQDESNGGRIEFIGAIDAKLLSGISKT
jgi:hypothetical protein